MEPQLLAAVVTASAGLGAAILKLAGSRSRARPAADSSQAVKKPILGLGAARLSTRLTLQTDGTGTLTRAWEGLKVSRPEPYPRIIDSQRLHAPQAVFRGPPRLLPSRFHKALDIQLLRRQPQDLTLAIGITGNLTSDDPELSFAYELDVSDFSPLTSHARIQNDESAPLFRHDSLRVEAPIHIAQLDLQILFPTSTAVRCFPLALDRHSETPKASETKRLHDGFHQVSNIATLRVRQPKLTCIYLIYWTLEPSHQYCS